MTYRNYVAYKMIYEGAVIYVGSGSLKRPKSSLYRSHIPFIKEHSAEIQLIISKPMFFAHSRMAESFYLAKYQPRFNKMPVYVKGNEYYLALKLLQHINHEADPVYIERLSRSFYLCEKSLAKVKHEFLITGSTLTYEQWLRLKVADYASLTTNDYKRLVITSNQVLRTAILYTGKKQSDVIQEARKIRSYVLNKDQAKAEKFAKYWIKHGY